MAHLTGVFCAALTPLDGDGNPDQAAFRAHCRWLLDEGCTGIAMLGTTGEANSFSSEERKTLLEAALAAGIKPGELLPGTGVAAVTETAELTKHALSVGVTSVVMLPPFYYKGVSEDGLVAAYSEIVDRIADDRLRVVLYHIPQMSAVPITHDAIARLRDRYPGTFVGIKDSAGDLVNMKAMVERFPGFCSAVRRRPADAAAAAGRRCRRHHCDHQPRRARPPFRIRPLGRPVEGGRGRSRTGAGSCLSRALEQLCAAADAQGHDGAPHRPRDLASAAAATGGARRRPGP